MSITLDTSPILSVQTGFTTAEVTSAVDLPPNGRSIQQVITGENSGTFPAGLSYHSSSSPFTFTIERPAVFKQIGAINPVTGQLGNVPRNVWKLRTRKGVLPLAGQSTQTMLIETKISIPAGADLADADSIRLAIGLHLGAAKSISAELGDSLVDGTL